MANGPSHPLPFQTKNFRDHDVRSLLQYEQLGRSSRCFAHPCVLAVNILFIHLSCWTQLRPSMFLATYLKYHITWLSQVKCAQSINNFYEKIHTWNVHISTSAKTTIIKKLIASCLSIGLLTNTKRCFRIKQYIYSKFLYV